VNPSSDAQIKKTFSHHWTAEKLATQDRKAVELIRDRAAKHGATDLVELCEHDLAQRSKKSLRATSIATRHLANDVVTGYHFVCERERGVTEAGTGRFWSGSWIVAEANVPKSIQVDAYLALHESKKERSYRQGRIVDFRRSPRDMVPQTDTGASPQIDEGIAFLVKETGTAYDWFGSGAGEKGYRWLSDSSAPNADIDSAGPGNQDAAL
jgi:hypothetical protein